MLGGIHTEGVLGGPVDGRSFTLGHFAWWRTEGGRCDRLHLANRRNAGGDLHR